MTKEIAKLKFRDTLPFRLELLMVNKFGFVIFSRLHGSYVIYTKREHLQKHPVNTDGLNEVTQTALIRRCNRIVDWYQDPDLFVPSIRTRLTGMAAVLPATQRQFVLDWMDREYPEKKVEHALLDM